MTRKGGANVSPPLDARQISNSQAGHLFRKMVAGPAICQCVSLFSGAFSHRKPASTSLQDATGPIKLRLTLFLQAKQGFGESFCGSGASRPHLFPA
jgi:hypothetical protein